MSNTKEIVYAVIHSNTQGDAEAIIDKYCEERERVARIEIVRDMIGDLAVHYEHTASIKKMKKYLVDYSIELKKELSNENSD